MTTTTDLQAALADLDGIDFRVAYCLEPVPAGYTAPQPRKRGARRTAAQRFAAFVASGAQRYVTGGRLAGWLKETIREYDLDSQNEFWRFFEEIRSETQASRSSNGRTRKAFTIETVARWQGASQHDRRALSAAFRFGFETDTRFLNPRDLRGVWRSVLSELELTELLEVESADAVLHLVYDLLAKEVSKRLAPRLAGIRAIRDAQTTRDRVFAFAIHTGNPPPAGPSETETMDHSVLLRYQRPRGSPWKGFSTAGLNWFFKPG